MTSEQIGGIVRALASAIGGYLVGQGIVDADTAATVGGAIVTIVVTVWSVWAKRVPA